jgi:multidrug resistance efflux pump
MAKLRRLVILLVLATVASGGYYWYSHLPPTPLVLTGIVTTNDVVVSSQVAGQIAELKIAEGDTVTRGQLLAVIAPGELQADRAYYEHSAKGVASQVRESEASLRFQERQLDEQIRQGEAAIAAAEAQRAAAQADLENARVTYERMQELSKAGLTPAQQLDEARTTFDAARARLDMLARQTEGQRAALQVTRANAEQVAARRNAVASAQAQLQAVGAQRAKADVRLSYTNIVAPLDGIVDVRAARQGEVVNPGQPIVSLINPEDYWVRADVEETYVDRVRIGDTFTVRLPSGDERTGTVFYRRADASFATQRDVSRTKRDIRTFETRLRVDNKDRRLAVGMTVYVLLPVH